MSNSSALHASNLSFAYADQPVLCDVTLQVCRGEQVAIVGRSGSGKSTLMYCLAGVTVPARGTVTFGDHAIHQLSGRDRAHLRLASFGFVYQFAELVPELSLHENVALPARLHGRSKRESLDRAASLLESVGLAGDVWRRRPGAVSGGQMQRAAIARALINDPAVIFADEPTGALDSENSASCWALIQRRARELDAALLVVTHEPALAASCDRTVEMKDGRICA